jgi:hypothetical protein
MASAKDAQRVIHGFGNITNTTIRGMPPAYFMEEMDTLPDGLRSLADQARKGTLPKAPSPEGDSAYEQALDFGASPDQALEAAMAAAQDMAVRQLQREAVAKAKAQASNAAAMAAVTHSDEALFGGALEDIDGGYARALASSFGVSPDALKESVASITQEVLPAPSLKANIGLPNYLRGGSRPASMTQGPDILGATIDRYPKISPPFQPQGPPQTPMIPGGDQTIIDRTIPRYPDISLRPQPAGTFPQATLANTYSQFEAEVTDDEVIYDAAPVAHPAGAYLDELVGLYNAGKITESVAIQLLQDTMKRYMGGKGTYSDLAAKKLLGIGERRAKGEAGQEELKELYPDALGTKDGDDGDDADDPYARTWTELERLEAERRAAERRAGGDGSKPTDESIEPLKLGPTDDRAAEGYLAGEGVFTRSLTGVHGLPFDQQYGMAAQRSLGSRWYNPRVQKYISAQRDAVYGRFVLQKLMASFNGAVYSPTFADLEAGSRGTEGQELYVDWLGRGYTQGRKEFYDPDTMRSSWNNLVRASDPGTYTHAKDDLLGYRYAVVAANERQQISAAKAMANITGYGPMGAIKEQGFQRLLDRFHQAKEFGGEKRGLAAWLADIKGSAWDPFGEVHGTSQVVSTKV